MPSLADSSASTPEVVRPRFSQEINSADFVSEKLHRPSFPKRPIKYTAPRTEEIKVEEEAKSLNFQRAKCMTVRIFEETVPSAKFNEAAGLTAKEVLEFVCQQIVTWVAMCDASKVTSDLMKSKLPCLFHRAERSILQDQSVQSKQEAMEQLMGVFAAFREMIEEVDQNGVDFQTCILVSLMLIGRLFKYGVYIHSNTA